MTQRVLVTGARTAIALELARALALEGCQVLLADCGPRPFAAYSRRCAGWSAYPAPRREPGRFVDAVADLVARDRVSLVIPAGEEGLYLAAARARVPCPVLCDEPERLDALHHKLRFQQLAAAHGPTPRTWSLGGPEHLADLLAASGRLVVKAAYGRFGAGTRVVTPASLVPLPARPGGWVAQELLEGRELCTWSVARAGRLLAHVVYEPLHRFALGPSYCFRRVEHPGADRWVARFLEAQGYTGLVGFDLMETPDGRLLPLECNPRATSGAHLFRAGDGLGRALLGRGAATPTRDAAMLGGVMLTHGLVRALRRPRTLLAWALDLARARDVVWRRDDPLPAVHQLGTVLHVLRLALEGGVREAVSAASAWEGGAPRAVALAPGLRVPA